MFLQKYPKYLRTFFGLIRITTFKSKLPWLRFWVTSGNFLFQHNKCKSVTFGVGTNVEFINDECGTLGIATLIFNQQRTEANQITELKYFLDPAQSIKYGSVFFISYSVNKIK